MAPYSSKSEDDYVSKQVLIINCYEPQLSWSHDLVVWGSLKIYCLSADAETCYFQGQNGIETICEAVIHVSRPYLNIQGLFYYFSSNQFQMRALLLLSFHV